MIKTPEQIAKDFRYARDQKIYKGLFVGTAAYFIGANLLMNGELKEVNNRRENNGKGLSVNHFSR